ncbi:MAG: hypothetical protein OQK32_07100 [Gammaproteobacteria bacterium]|nr:hypothetical protein [Gammaproteobacteria bacterium]MCW8922672.1 hypothetical protein [Gammaproteobacteria bacterium]
MFKKFIEKLKSLSGEHTSFDPASLNDPLAMQTEWSPAKGGGANFKTHNLVQITPNRIEFQASTGAKLFYLIFALAGVAVLIGFPVASASSNEIAFNIDTIMPMLIGFIFLCVGSALFYFGTAPVVFDKTKGYFWKGRKSPDQVAKKIMLKSIADLNKIYALQLISEYVRGNKSSYYSYELNLVLKNGKRINVIDHGNQEKLRDDADTLASFLGKPVWDAT